MSLQKKRIAIIGLGYVGLPLAVEFAKKYEVIGFDINLERVTEISSGLDSTQEVEVEKLKSVVSSDPSVNKYGLLPTSDSDALANCNIYIVTVPTPTDKFNRPVLEPMLAASRTIGKYLKKGDIVIYESTVYPGVTEDECVPVLQGVSKLFFNRDFFVGYSPERINPGDKEHTVSTILKVTSGSTKEVAEEVDQLYKSIIKAGTFKASSIRVAEAAKVIENSQRDINIAFVNELAKIFNLLKIDTNEVLEAAATKWNFLKFKPGLVGGHCIGVDPYYLAQKAIEVGYHPEIILAGRRTNDNMGKYVANEVTKQMIHKNILLKGSKALILGFTFKEDCPDVRNTRVIDIYHELTSFGINVDVYDPKANKNEVNREYGIDLLPHDKPINLDEYSALILAVAHSDFKNLNIKKSNSVVVYDVKGILPINDVDSRL